jgi:hypothetical protein
MLTRGLIIHNKGSLNARVKLVRHPMTHTALYSLNTGPIRNGHPAPYIPNHVVCTQLVINRRKVICASCVAFEFDLYRVRVYCELCVALVCVMGRMCVCVLYFRIKRFACAMLRPNWYNGHCLCFPDQTHTIHQTCMALSFLPACFHCFSSRRKNVHS